MTPWLYDRYKAVLTWFGDIYLAHEPPLCKAAQIEDMMRGINAGDIICRGYNAYLDSHFIPGVYTHSGIVINSREMVHAIAEGVCSIHPIDFIKDTDRFIVLRPKWIDADEERGICIERAIWHCDVNTSSYDFTFDDDARFYCHEFTADCLGYAGVVVDKTRKVFGVWPFRFQRELYLAQNIIDVCDVIYEFAPDRN